MTKIRLTKLFSFEAAHALMNYDGPCRNIHGHSYKLVVTIIGTPLNDCLSPKNGMVMDFGDLKEIIKKSIIEKFDHSLILNEKTTLPDLKKFKEIFSKLVLLPYQPTCENLLNDFAENIRKLLPPEISLHSLKLIETDSSSAAWYSQDNE
ncbi:6-pyruvoyl tetrahydropterin synthase family protein [candidate division KSB1 bacterium]